MIILYLYCNIPEENFTIVYHFLLIRIRLPPKPTHLVGQIYDHVFRTCSLQSQVQTYVLGFFTDTICLSSRNALINPLPHSNEFLCGSRMNGTGKIGISYLRKYSDNRCWRLTRSDQSLP